MQRNIIFLFLEFCQFEESPSTIKEGIFNHWNSETSLSITVQTNFSQEYSHYLVPLSLIQFSLEEAFAVFVALQSKIQHFTAEQDFLPVLERAIQATQIYIISPSGLCEEGSHFTSELTDTNLKCANFGCFCIQLKSTGSPSYSTVQCLALTWNSALPLSQCFFDLPAGSFP